ncbi:GCN5-related N-acetyltransferase 5, chloroplastic-like protein [Drosera capensis]
MAATLLILPLHHHQHHHIPRIPQFPFTSSPFLSKSHPKPYRIAAALPRPSPPPSLPSSEPSPTPTPLHSGRFMTPAELQQLQLLENYTYSVELPSGSLTIRPMRDEEIDTAADLLAGSFAESMKAIVGYRKLLGYVVREYLIERRGLLPHAVTLLGVWREEVAGIVEMSFDARGANTRPHSPAPPEEEPYICNMTVKESLRRRGIGWHLLKASEELISLMNSSREIYLHCRMIDSAPFNMYTKAGYEVVKTDGLSVLLTLQRRKHLMCKRLPDLPSEVATPDLDEKAPS